MSNNTVLYEKNENIAVVTLNRPERLNAITRELLSGLIEQLETAGKDTDVVAVILTGAGEKAFVAGADISFMQQLSALEGREFGKLGHEVMRTVENFSRPVIAAVNGFALGGGCELAMACDFRIASDNARFGQPEVNLGVIPGFGGTQRLPRLVGRGHAMELIFTGDMIDAVEACRIGLVNRVVALEQLLPECLGVTEKIGQKGPVAIRLGKEAVATGMEMDIARACQYEADLFGVCFSSDDQKEGMQAFLDKRKATFTGK